MTRRLLNIAGYNYEARAAGALNSINVQGLFYFVVFHRGIVTQKFNSEMRIRTVVITDRRYVTYQREVL